MSFAFLDSTARTAWGNATTQTGQLAAFLALWSGDVSVRYYTSGGTHLGTATHGGWDAIDTSTTPYSVTLAGRPAWSHLADGTAAYCIVAVPGGADIIRADASLADAVSSSTGVVNLDDAAGAAGLRISATASLPVDASGLPAYIASLAPYEVRACTGTYAPTNGDTTIQDATPTEWLGDINIIYPWSGGAKGTGHFLDVTGGGHSDSANNGVYRFDYRGTSEPTGWTVRGLSPLADVNTSNDLYDDGGAASTHTYDGIVRVANGDIYKFNGGPYPDAGIAPRGYKLSAEGVWSKVVSDFGSEAGGVGCPTWYDPATNKIFLLASNQYAGKFYRCSADTLSSAVSAASATPINGYGSAAWDTIRGRGLVLSNYLNSIAIDFSAETATLNETPLTVSDYSAITGKCMSLAFDEVADCYWAFGGEYGSSGWTTLYRIDAATYALTSSSLTGDSITVRNPQVGSFGRWVINTTWRMIGTVASATAAAVVIRLPSS